MSKEKLRAAKEAVYEEANKDVRSVCSGQFFIKNRNTYEKCKNCENCFKFKEYSKKKEDTPEVHYHYISTFRNCEFYKYRPKDDTYVLTTAIYNIVYVNDLACASVINLMDKVKNQDKETQKIFGALVKRQRAYEEDFSNILVKSQDFLAEYNSYMDERIQDKLEAFQKAMIHSFTSRGYENAEFIALVEVMRTIIGYSVVSVEKRIQECLKYNKDSVNLRYYKLNEMKKIAENLSDWTKRKCKGLNLNDEKDVIDAYRELDKALTSSDIINEALYKAKDLYNV